MWDIIPDSNEVENSDIEQVEQRTIPTLNDGILFGNKNKAETLDEKVRQAMIGVLKDIPSLGAAFSNIILKNTLNKYTLHDPNHESINHHHPPPESNRTHDDLTALVPSVTILELPSKPGCRSFSHKTCLKIPIVVPKNVPYEECRNVPAVECFFVLKTVDDIECSPTSYEDCTDTAVDVPCLDREEQCEDIEYDDFVDVEEQVPIQVCTVKDPRRKQIRK